MCGRGVVANGKGGGEKSFTLLYTGGVKNVSLVACILIHAYRNEGSQLLLRSSSSRLKLELGAIYLSKIDISTEMAWHIF